MTISIQNRPAEQHKEHTFMPTQTATAITNANQSQEQFMNHPTANFLMTSPAKSSSESIIIHNEHGVMIEQSLRNVSVMASTWYKNSTSQLYAVLGQCYELHYLVETADSSQRDKYRDDVKAAYVALGGAQGANSLLSRIVSVVFNFADLDRRQRSRYSSVIKAAYVSEQQPIDAAGFINWLEHAGGIVAALEKRSDTSSTKVEQSEINETVRAMPAKAQLNIANSGNRFVVLLAQPIDSETVEVLYQFEEDSIGDSLATKAYKAQLKLAKDAEKRSTAAIAADRLAGEGAGQEVA